MARSVEYARRYGIPIHVRSSFSGREGTWVVDSSSPRWAAASKERAVIGVSQDRTQARVTIVGVPGTPGISAKIFGLMADAGISIDMLVQNNLMVNGSGAEISFTLNRDDASVALTRLSESQDRLGFEALLQDDHITKVSVVGSGMTSKAGVAAKVFEVLAAEAINISMISTSDMRISVIVKEADSVRAVKAIHSVFDLADSDGAPAVVYGGSGR
jgi:aspartate kinase